MIIGVESTAHTFGVGVCDKGKILSNVRDMYKPTKGGIIPSESAEHHRRVADKIWNESLDIADIKEKEIDAIAFSYAPGLAPCLIAGMEFVKKKAKLLNVPIVPVNHCIAHLEIGRHEGAKDPVLLYVSGANTQVIAFVSGRYRIFGETLDMGVGNFLDSFARLIGVAFPGGPEIEKLARKGKYVELPYSVKGMDVAFSGMLTKAQQLINNKVKKEDVCFSSQETAFAMLVEVAERALAHTGKKELVLGGGVACNSRLQEMCKIMCRGRKAKLFVPNREFLVDNGGMIAYTGEMMFKSGVKMKFGDLDIKPRERTDEVSVKWRKI